MAEPRSFSFRPRPGLARDVALDFAEGVAAEVVGPELVLAAKALAPKLTGEGAASIGFKVVVAENEVYVDVSYDDEHFYMGFQELGTENTPPRPFLRPALESYRL